MEISKFDKNSLVTSRIFDRVLFWIEMCCHYYKYCQTTLNYFIVLIIILSLLLNNKNNKLREIYRKRAV